MGSPALNTALHVLQPLPVTMLTTVLPAGMRPSSTAFFTPAVPAAPAGSPNTPGCGPAGAWPPGSPVGHVTATPSRLPDGAEGLVRVAGHPHGDGVGQGVLRHGFPRLSRLDGPVQGAAASACTEMSLGSRSMNPAAYRSLSPFHAPAWCSRPLPTGRCSRVRTSELLQNLQGDGLFALGEVGLMAALRLYQPQRSMATLDSSKVSS